MKLKKSLRIAWNFLVNSKLRSWLTIIGIVIGIAAVVSIVSISEGAQQAMEDRFSTLGADIITISPGFSKAMNFHGPPGMGGQSESSDQEPLTEKDVLLLKTIPNIKSVLGAISGSAEIKYLGEGGDVRIEGVDTSVWKDMITEELESGRYLTKSDVYSVILGYKRAHEFFDNEVQINRQVTINGRLFKVVGIFDEGQNDNAVIIPLQIARGILEDVDEKELNSISLQVKDVDIIDETIKTITKKLMLSRGILKEDERDFTVSSVKELLETINESLNMMALFLGAIAAISLVVGGVGISNTMFTAVLEKTKEIGVMKAIGAKNKDIMLIFLFNSGMIGFVGGIGGVICGSVISSIISYFISSSSGTGGPEISTALSPELLFFAFFFSVAIGMIAGAIPAYNASKLNPVDALRYE